MPDGRIVLGTRRYSSWSMRGWLAVRLARLDVEEVVIPLQGNGQTAAVKRIAPHGLVPYLEHRGNRVWESLSILEYCAEQEPAIWPREAAARAHARSIAAEMHAGFAELRRAMPMNLGRQFPGSGRSAGALADIARVEAIWAETRARFGGGGPFLFGPAFGGADAMFAPVVTRFVTYLPEVSAETRAYCAAVRAHPLIDAWYEAAAAEPADWRLPTYEAAP
jgi:glutathione S-transferase